VTGRTAADGRRGPAWPRRAALAGAAAALAASGLLVGAGPALAAPSVTLTSPDPSAPLGSSTLHIAGQAGEGSNGSISSINIQVTSLEGHGGGSRQVAPNGNPSQFVWDFVAAYNGNYRITVTVQGKDSVISSTSTSTATEDVAVDAKPVTPANVKAAVGTDRSVTLTWDANPEPDIIGYQIQRSLGSNQWSAAGNTSDTSFTDTATESRGGTYQFRVIAVRPSSASDQGIASDPSAPASAAVADPPTATTAAGSGSGSGSGSGTGSGSGSRSGGGTGTTVPGNRAGSTDTSPLVATNGTVDLHQFAALLDANRKPAPTAPTVTEPDPGFNQRLPFKGRKGAAEVGADGTALAAGGHESGGSEGRQPIAFVAASLLATVVLMHLLWLKRQVDKGPLPALADLPVAAEADDEAG
jgi:hypothetical protein